MKTFYVKISYFPGKFEKPEEIQAENLRAALDQWERQKGVRTQSIRLRTYPARHLEWVGYHGMEPVTGTCF